MFQRRVMTLRDLSKEEPHIRGSGGLELGRGGLQSTAAATGAAPHAASNGLPVKIETADLNGLRRDGAGTSDLRAERIPIIGMRPVEDAALSEHHSVVVGQASVERAQSNKTSWGVEAVLESRMETGVGVTVAILDSGIRSTHKAFSHLVQNNALITRNFTNGSPEDETGHGTHCAGTFFGQQVDGVRIGVAPGVKKALVGKVLGDGAGSTELVDAMKWALDEGAQVVSMSLGFDFVGFQEKLKAEHGFHTQAAASEALSAYVANIRFFDAFMDLAHVYGDRAIFIAATGNESKRPDYTIDHSSPAAAMRVLSVGALGKDNNGEYFVANFSNRGPDMVAPGVGVVSAGMNSDSDLVSKNGTSMATPHIAGLAALYWEKMTNSGGHTDAETVLSEMRANARKTTQHEGMLATFQHGDIGIGMPIARD